MGQGGNAKLYFFINLMQIFSQYISESTLISNLEQSIKVKLIVRSFKEQKRQF